MKTTVTVEPHPSRGYQVYVESYGMKEPAGPRLKKGRWQRFEDPFGGAFHGHDKAEIEGSARVLQEYLNWLETKQTKKRKGRRK